MAVRGFQEPTSGKKLYPDCNRWFDLTRSFGPACGGGAYLGSANLVFGDGMALRLMFDLFQATRYLFAYTRTPMPDEKATRSVLEALKAAENRPGPILPPFWLAILQCSDDHPSLPETSHWFSIESFFFPSRNLSEISAVLYFMRRKSFPIYHDHRGKALAMARRFAVCLPFLIFWEVVLSSPIPPLLAQTPRVVHRIWVLPLSGAVTPPMASYLHRWFDRAKERHPSLIILSIDTPGGLSGSMRSIIKDILASPVPVVGYVAPGGARAASAGTYILYACPLAAMAPGTNVGSATPIPVGGSISLLPEPARTGKGSKPSSPSDTEERKIVNDAVAYIRSLAEMNGRNAAWAEKAVLSAANLSARQALDQHVIDLISPDIPTLLGQIDGRTLTLHGRKILLHLEPASLRIVRPQWKDRLLEILSRPELAYLLFLLGVVVLAFEFSHPGFVLPGITGLMAIILAFYAFTILPVNLTGLLLLLLGISLMVAEVLVGAFGGLAVAGIVSFFLGSLFFFRAPEGEVATPASSYLPLILLLTLLVSGFFLGLIRLALKARMRPVLTGFEGTKGERGTALDSFQKKGRVRLHSEIWWATSPVPVKEGEQVVIEGMTGLTLKVRPASEEAP